MDTLKQPWRPDSRPWMPPTWPKAQGGPRPKGARCTRGTGLTRRASYFGDARTRTRPTSQPRRQGRTGNTRAEVPPDLPHPRAPVNSPAAGSPAAGESAHPTSTAAVATATTAALQWGPGLAAPTGARGRGSGGRNLHPRVPVKPYTFPHHNLRVFPLSVDLAVECRALAKSLPRGNAALADQLLRASQAVPLLVAEGSNRRTGKQERQRYVEARGEVGEAAAALELIARLQLAPANQLSHCWDLATPVHAMLSRLVSSCS